MSVAIAEPPAPPKPAANSPEQPNAMAGGGMGDFLSSIRSDDAPPGDPPNPNPPPPVPDPPKPGDKAPPIEGADDAEKWPRSAQDWDKFKAKRKERETALAKERDDIKVERDKLNGEIEALRKAGPSPELDGLKKERDELSERLRLVAVEQHPKFKAYFEGKTNAQLEMAKRIVGAEEANRVAELLSLPDSPHKESALENIFSVLSPVKQGQLAGVMNSLTQIQQERETEIANARENYTRMTAAEQAKATAQRDQLSKAAAAAFTAEVTKVQGELEPFKLRTGDGKEVTDWNAGVQARIDQAKKLIFDSAKITLPEVSRYALQAAAYPALETRYKELEKETASLRTQVAKLSAATPGLGETHANGGDAAPTALKSGSTPAQAAAHFLDVIRRD